LLFIVFIAEKSSPHRYGVEQGRRASIAVSVMMEYSCRRVNQNEAVSEDECFSFGLLPFLISVSSSSATVSSAGSSALNNGSLIQGRYIKRREILFDVFTQQ
jgi:hypothetical protein